MESVTTKTMNRVSGASCALWFAVGLTFANPAFGANKSPFSEVRYLHSYETFLQICVAPQPNIGAVNAALKSAQVQAMSTEGATMGGSLLGLEQTMGRLDISKQHYQGGYIISKPLSKIAGKAVVAAVITGTAHARALKRDITICSVGVQNGSATKMKTLIVDFLEREPDYTSTSNLPDGDKTNWLNWNTSGSKKGVLMVGVASPAGAGNPEELFHHFVSVGLQPE